MNLYKIKPRPYLKSATNSNPESKLGRLVSMTLLFYAPPLHPPSTTPTPSIGLKTAVLEANQISPVLQSAYSECYICSRLGHHSVWFCYRPILFSTICCRHWRIFLFHQMLAVQAICSTHFYYILVFWTFRTSIN